MTVEGRCSAAATRCEPKALSAQGLTCVDLCSVIDHSTMEPRASSPCCRQVCLSAPVKGCCLFAVSLIEAVDATALVNADSLI